MASRKIKILMTIRQGKIGGGETHLLDLVDNLDKSQFEPIVLSFTEGEMIARFKSMGIKNHVIYTERPFDYKIWPKVKELIIEEQIDVVHAHGTRACSNSFRSANALGIPLIYTVHAWSFHANQIFFIRKFREISESYLCKKTDVNICVSKSNEEDGKRLFNLKNSRVIENGINIRKYDPELEYSDIRKEFGIPTDVLLVGYIVRLTEQKDPLSFVRAIKIVTSTDPKIKFLIVGDGDLKEATIKLAQELGIGEYIIFCDFRSDVPAILKAIDIYCLPSLWEGLPIGLLEAMAMKRGVVASAVDGTKGVVTNGHNGLLVSPRNPGQIAEAILRLQRDRRLLSTLGNNARKTIEERYTIQLMTDSVEKVYTQIISEKLNIPN